MSATAPTLVLTGGAITLGTSFKTHGGFPPNAVLGVAGTLGLTAVAMWLSDTRAEPIVRGLAWLFLIAAVIKSVEIWSRNPKAVPARDAGSSVSKKNPNAMGHQ